MQPLHPGIIFLPRSLKTWTWKLSPLLPPNTTENRQNVPKVGPRRLPKSTLKSIKLDLWASMCPLTAPNTSGVHPRGVWSAHWVSPWTPGSPKWCPRYPKMSLKVSKMTALSQNVTHFSRYQVQGTRYQVPGTRYQAPGTS